MPEDIRWKQRFDNYLRALAALSDAAALARTRPLTPLEEQGVIQAFEFTHELAWNVLKDYLEYQGVGNIVGSRGAVREAFRNGLLADGEAWMLMIRDRNLSSHTYDQETTREIVGRVLAEHHPAFVDLARKFRALYDDAGTA